MEKNTSTGNLNQKHRMGLFSAQRPQVYCPFIGKATGVLSRYWLLVRMSVPLFGRIKNYVTGNAYVTNGTAQVMMMYRGAFCLSGQPASGAFYLRKI